MSGSRCFGRPVPTLPPPEGLGQLRQIHMLFVCLENYFLSVDNAKVLLSLVLKRFSLHLDLEQGMCAYVEFIFNFITNFSFISLAKACLALILSWTSLRGGGGVGGGRNMSPKLKDLKSKCICIKVFFIFYITTFVSIRKIFTYDLSLLISILLTRWHQNVYNCTFQEIISTGRF